MSNRSATLTIQQAFLKPCLVNLNKNTHLVFYISQSQYMRMCDISRTIAGVFKTEGKQKKCSLYTLYFFAFPFPVIKVIHILVVQIDSDFLPDLGKYLESSGKFYNSIKSIYASTVSAIPINNKLNEWFDYTTRVRQGCNLLPTLYSVFTYDLV